LADAGSELQAAMDLAEPQRLGLARTGSFDWIA
jgi:hypothetical protein